MQRDVGLQATIRKAPSLPGGARGFAATVSAGSSVLALPSTSELIVYQPDGKQFTEIKRYQVAQFPTYAHPIIAGNRIFIKDQETLALWTVE